MKIRKGTRWIRGEDRKCPICGSGTVVRISKKGTNAGRRFNVCIQYPGCRGRVAVGSVAKTNAVHNIKILKRVLGLSAIVIVGAIVLVGVGMILAPRFGWHVDILYGGSMEPTMHVGSLAVVRPVDPHDVSAGDIIAYVPPVDESVRTTHRVAEVLQDEHSLAFQTKGDANEDLDTYTVPAENVRGKVWFSVPYLGYFMDYIKKPLGFGLVIGIPAAIIVAFEFRNIFSSFRDLKRKGRAKRDPKRVKQASP